MTTNSCDDTGQAKSPLLALPPELRNRVYRFSLVQTARIDITQIPSLPSEPDILSVNRQIREEAADIYYKENTFCFYIHDHNPSIWQKWHGRSARHSLSRQVLVMVPSTNWKNLLAWLKAYRNKGCSRPIRPPGSGLPPRICDHFFDIVKQLAVAGVRWDAIEPSLESMHQILVMKDPAWA